jgi:hypothetical protein
MTTAERALARIELAIKARQFEFEERCKNYDAVKVATVYARLLTLREAAEILREEMGE